MNNLNKSLAVALLVTLPGTTAANAASRCNADMTTREYPARDWTVQSPVQAGWSQDGLNAAWAIGAKKFSSGMLIYKGKMIGSFGDISTPFETRSMRKAFVSAIVGQLIDERKINLNATLGSLGIDDYTPLTAVEKTATVRDLLTSRSGINLPAAYVVPGDDTNVPPRGSHKPGEAFFYWNWGFNALGGIVEKITGTSVFKLFEKRLAGPLQMQDFNRTRDTQYRADKVSKYPAYLFDISTRDRARLGLLYLNQGCWRGRQVVNPAWVRDSIAPVTEQQDDFDYGYLWWSTEAPKDSGLTQRIFMARGFANQYIIGIPEIDTVFVLSVDMSNGEEKLRQGLRPPGRRDFQAVFDQVLKSRPGA